MPGSGRVLTVRVTLSVALCWIRRDLRLADNDSKNTAGIGVVEMLRKRGIPARVIVKSSYLTVRARAQLQQLGVFAIVDKDGGIDQLLQLIADALSES